MISFLGGQLYSGRGGQFPVSAEGIVVSETQTRLAQARDHRVAALYRHYVARINLADAAGAAQVFIQGRI